MSPDFPLFLHWPRGYAFSHSLAGVATVDMAVSLTVVWLWFALFRDAMIDLGPDAVRARLHAHVRLTPRDWILSVPAAWLGAFTHVAWDSFTHSDRWGSERIAWLGLEYEGMPRYEWAQYASTLIGLAVVGVGGILFLRRMPPVHEPDLRPRWVAVLLPAALLVGTFVGLLVLSSHAWPMSPSTVLTYALNVSIATCWSVAGLCVAWRLFLRPTAMGGNASLSPPDA